MPLSYENSMEMLRFGLPSTLNRFSYPVLHEDYCIRK